MPALLISLRGLLADAAFPWAICGGYALEIFAGRTIRPHGDIDLSLPESARKNAISFFLSKGWTIYEYRGMGKVKPIYDPADSTTGRNLMAVCGGDAPVQFFPSEEEGLLYHQFTPSMTGLNFLDLLFSPAQGKPFLLRDGLPILAPEVALLYKAAHPDEPAAQQDYAAVYPELTDEQRAWLHAGLAARYSGGHPWLNEQEYQR